MPPLLTEDLCDLFSDGSKCLLAASAGFNREAGSSSLYPEQSFRRWKLDTLPIWFDGTRLPLWWDYFKSVTQARNLALFPGHPHLPSCSVSNIGQSSR